jgi:histidinol phosphatase-like enzyme
VCWVQVGVRHSRAARLGKHMMVLVLLDHDGVVIVNRATNVKRPANLELVPGVAEAIARLNGAGFDVAICTNQPEVARGVSRRRSSIVFMKPSAGC